MPAPRLESRRAAAASAGIGLVLVAAAMIVPRALGEDVRVHWPPLMADWRPNVGWLTVPAVLVGVALALTLPALATRLSWRWLPTLGFAGTWLWTWILTLTEGTEGLRRVFARPGEYTYDAFRVRDVSHAVRTFIDHIPHDSVDHWHTHVAGHPPGALLFFVYLDRLGVSSYYWIGMVVMTLACTGVVAVLWALRTLGDEATARRALPWLVLAPSAVWVGVSADAMYGAVAAWGLALLAHAAVRRARWSAVLAGLLLASCIYLSYGLPLLGVLALAVLWIARSWRPLPWALAGSAVVVAAWTAAGFAWWKAYPVLVARYNDGIAHERAYSYWVWGDVAAWSFSVGLAVWAAFPRGIAAARRGDVVARLALAGVVSVLLASATGMSKAEVERIFLPFTLWVVALPMLLPSRWHRPMLLAQVLLALLVQSLLLTRW